MRYFINEIPTTGEKVFRDTDKEDFEVRKPNKHVSLNGLKGDSQDEETNYHIKEIET